jgi:uncharacterized membrane protein (UPF0127 family)
VHAARSGTAFALAALVAVVVGVAAASTSPATPTAANLTLDGVPFRPELALTSSKRATGLMNRRKAPPDGMLFVFSEDTTGAFWMKNTLVPLTIAFFDANGVRVRKLSMTPCREDPCPLYEPRRRYRFALELAATDTRPAKRIGPPWKLRRLSRSAR